jgi:hypothetical protein
MTKIAFEDFERQVVQRHLIKSHTDENASARVERANAWIAGHDVDVINVESLSPSARATIRASATGIRAFVSGIACSDGRRRAAT